MSGWNEIVCLALFLGVALRNTLERLRHFWFAGVQRRCAAYS